MKNLNPSYQFPYIILASTSPRRKQFLEELGIPHKVVASEAVEKEEITGDPIEIAIHNANIKAEAVSASYPDDLILAADTVVALDDRIFHKPQTLDEAREMFRTFSGKTQAVYTGVCFLCKNKNIHELHSTTSYVTFKTLTSEVIDQYINLVNPLDRAGGWSIQNHADLIIEGYEGSFSNIAGLSIEFVQEWIRGKGVVLGDV